MAERDWFSEHPELRTRLHVNDHARLNRVLSEYGYSVAAWIRAMISRCESDRIESQGDLKKIIPPELPKKAADLFFEKAEEIRRMADRNYARDHLYDERKKLREEAEQLDDLGAQCMEWCDEIQVRKSLAEQGDRRTKRHRYKDRSRAG